MLQTSRNMQAFAILIVNGNAVGIFFNVHTFFIFDPHARNTVGLFSENGTCVLGMVRSISKLCLFVRSLFNTSSQTFTTVQYDLHNIKLSMSQKKTRKYNNIDRLTIIQSDKQLYETYLTFKTDNGNSSEGSSTETNILKTRKRHNLDSCCHKFQNPVKNPKFPSTKTLTENEDKTLIEIIVSESSTMHDCVGLNGVIDNQCNGATTTVEKIKNNNVTEKSSSTTIQLIDLPFLDEVVLPCHKINKREVMLKVRVERSIMLTKLLINSSQRY